METSEILETKKKDLLLISWHNLDIEPDFNIRKDYGDLNELADSISQHGVLVPMSVRANRETPGRYYVVQGHRRYFAIKILIDSEKIQDIRIPVVPERKGTTEIDRLIDMAVGNEGKNLEILEFAELIKRFKNHNMTSAEIAKKLSKSVGHINNSLRLLELPETIKKAITGKKLSPSLVMQVVRETKNETEAVKILSDAMEETGGSGGDGGKVTKKTLDKKRGKYNSIRIIKNFATKKKHLKVLAEKKDTFDFIMKIINGKLSEEAIQEYFYESEA